MDIKSITKQLEQVMGVGSVVYNEVYQQFTILWRYELRFEDLQRMSEITGTNNINITHDYGYYPGEDETEIIIRLDQPPVDCTEK